MQACAHELDGAYFHVDARLCAGIAHNKILAKLASGMHKPSQQTVVTLDCVSGLMAALPIPKLRQLGGKFGEEVMAALKISTVGPFFLASCSYCVSQTHGAIWLVGSKCAARVTHTMYNSIIGSRCASIPVGSVITQKHSMQKHTPLHEAVRSICIGMLAGVVLARAITQRHCVKDDFDMAVQCRSCHSSWSLHERCQTAK